MIAKFNRLPWPVRALLCWGGMVAGILICFLVSVAEVGTTMPVLEPLALLTGWGMAGGCPLLLMHSRTEWDD